MSNSITFTIAKGAAPFEAELLGSGIPKATYPALGTYTIPNVINGAYTLQITDSNDCVYEQDLLVDPAVTTTTTTMIPSNSIVIGNAQDQMLIFNPVATNRNSEYSGFPDPNIVTLYLWFKTYNELPLTNDVIFSYDIYSTGSSGISTFQFIDVSDQIHMEVQETNVGPISPLQGNILLKQGFIESFFEYKYIKGATNKRFVIDMSSIGDNVYPNIPTIVEAGTIYGIDTLLWDRIIFNY